MKYPEHTSARFDAELGAVCARAMEMYSTVESQFQFALDSLVTGDLVSIDRVVDEGHLVNAMEVEIDEKCTDILVRRQPTANDLRLVAAIIKTVNDLERIGDESENIARMSRLIAQNKPLRIPCQPQIKYIADVALGMLNAAMGAFNAMDADAAKEVRRRNVLIEDEFQVVIRHLVAHMMEDASEFSETLQVALVVRAIERTGEHAKNISEYVVYMVEGREARNYCTI